MLRRTVTVLLIQISIWVVAPAGAAEPRDLAGLRSVRSLAAEAAVVLRLGTDNKVTSTYTQAMKDNTRAQLHDIDESAGKADAELHRAIADTMTALERNDAPALQAIAERLFGKAGSRGPTD
jgi:hypothetical protein